MKDRFHLKVFWVSYRLGCRVMLIKNETYVIKKIGFTKKHLWLVSSMEYTTSHSYTIVKI